VRWIDCHDDVAVGSVHCGGREFINLVGGEREGREGERERRIHTI
jgi:hypothetical protein